MAVYSNFVSSLDGVVTLGEGTSAGSVISGKYPADRFLMALLRACADAVLLGAGTLRATPGHLWTPAHVFPQHAEGFEHGGWATIYTARGAIDASHVAIQHGALIFTTRRGAEACRPLLPDTCEVVVMGDGEEVDLGAAIHELRNRNLGVLLTEGGPHLMGELIGHGLLDEVFLTLSPVVAGRADERRLGMVEGVELLPKRGVRSRLLSARRHGEYLFLRHSLRP